MSRDPSLPWTITGEGLLLTVRLTPKGGRDAIEGIEPMADGRRVLKARVRAASTDGEANAALIKMVAHTLAVPPSRVTLMSGATARVKRLKVAGDAGALATTLQNTVGVLK